MPHYLVLATDGTDADAPARRAAHLPAHSAVTGPMVAAGVIVAGGSLLDDRGAVSGSVALVNVESREALDHWLATEPYVVNKVWEHVEVRPVFLRVGLR